MDALSGSSWSSLELQPGELDGLVNSTFDSAATGSTGADIDASLNAIDEFLALVADSSNVSFSAGAAGGQGNLKSRSSLQRPHSNSSLSDVGAKAGAATQLPPGSVSAIPLRKFAESVQAAAASGSSSVQEAGQASRSRSQTPVDKADQRLHTEQIPLGPKSGSLGLKTFPLQSVNQPSDDADFDATTPTSTTRTQAPGPPHAPATAGTDPTSHRSPPSTSTQGDPQRGLATLRELASSLPPQTAGQETPTAGEQTAPDRHSSQEKSTAVGQGRSMTPPLLGTSPAQVLHFDSPPSPAPETTGKAAGGAPTGSQRKRRAKPKPKPRLKAMSPVKQARAGGRGGGQKPPKRRKARGPSPRAMPPSPKKAQASHEQQSTRGWLEMVPRASASEPRDAADTRTQHYIIHPGDDTIVLDIQQRRSSDGTFHWPHMTVQSLDTPQAAAAAKLVTEGGGGRGPPSTPPRLQDSSAPAPSTEESSAAATASTPPLPPRAQTAQPRQLQLPSPALLRAQAALADVASAEQELEHNMSALAAALRAEADEGTLQQTAAGTETPRASQQRLPSPPPLDTRAPLREPETPPFPSDTFSPGKWDAHQAEHSLSALDSRVAGLSRRLQSVASGFGIVPPPPPHDPDTPPDQPQAPCMPPLTVLLRTIQAKCEAERDGATARSQAARQRVQQLVAQAEAAQARLQAHSAEAQSVLYADAAAHAAVTAALLRQRHVQPAVSAARPAHSRRKSGSRAKSRTRSTSRQRARTSRTAARSRSRPHAGQARAASPLRRPGWRK